MGQIVMVLGRSGSGKSSSLRSFAPDEIGVFSCAGKRLPFRSRLPVVETRDYARIIDALRRGTRNAYAVDDATYLMAFDNFDRAKESGYGKFTDMAVSFERLLAAASQGTRPDVIVYFLMHPDYDENGNEKPKTIGKMLDEKLCVEGMFPIVIDCETVAGEDGRPRHVFVAENDGRNLAKSPMGMFAEPVMDNDLRAVDSIIRDYWGLAPLSPSNTRVTQPAKQAIN